MRHARESVVGAQHGQRARQEAQGLVANQITGTITNKNNGSKFDFWKQNSFQFH